MTAPPTSVDCDARRPPLDLRLLFTAMLLAALWSSLVAITSVSSKVVLAIMALTYLFGCWKTRRAVLYLFPAMYLPYFLWLLGDWPSDEYRQQWIAALWHLPGMLAGSLIYPPNVPTFQIISSLATLSLFFALLVPARISTQAARNTSGIVILISLLNGLVVYQLFKID